MFCNTTGLAVDARVHRGPGRGVHQGRAGAVERAQPTGQHHRVRQPGDGRRRPLRGRVPPARPRRHGRLVPGEAHAEVPGLAQSHSHAEDQPGGRAPAVAVDEDLVSGRERFDLVQRRFMN